MSNGALKLTANDDRVVNLGQLCALLGITANTLRAIISQAPDFPVLERGAKGVPYTFDRDAALAWWRGHKAAEERAAEARRQQLECWRRELAGAAEDDDAGGLSPAERKRLAEAVLAEDRNRVAHGELLRVADLEARLVTAGAELQRRVITMPQRLAKRFGWSRADRAAVESEIRATLNAFAADVGHGLLDREDG